MLTLISPAKNLDYDSPIPSSKTTKAAMLADSDTLVAALKKLAPQDIASLMHLSDKLAHLNYERFQDWQLPFPKGSARQAIFAFNGDVYAGLDAYTMGHDDLAFAQDHLRILSGLYGLLRPMDAILPYRLEMGTKFANDRGKDLYAFWGDLVTDALNKQLAKTASSTLVNLASQEYFKAVKPKMLKADIVTPIFKDLKNGQYKIISFYAKKARGRMSAYIIKNKINSADALQAFDWDGYGYNAELSQQSELVFTRDEAP